MIFGKEREAVRNATRAIRDLVLRREPGRWRLRQRPGRDGDDGGGAATAAPRHRDARSRHATRSGRADDGDPGHPAARAHAVVRGAGAGGQRPLRLDAARALPEPARRGDGQRQGCARAPGVPRGVAPADGRRGAHHQPVPARRPLPRGHRRRALQVRRAAVDRAAKLHAARVASRLRISGAGAAVHRQPVPAGAGRAAAVRIADDTRSFRALEDHPQVKAAIARIESRAPVLDTSHPQPGDDDRVVADIRRQALYVTAFGRQFYEACEYRPEHAG